ncbi:MAG: Bug family tripartite tricarboxylate transporter substrate binding protein [Beijerinckiaceae bacterium]
MNFLLRAPSLKPFLALIALMLVVNGSKAIAQPVAWPTEKPIKWLIGVPPGGTADPITRAVTSELSRRIGQSIVIEHKPGANQSIARGEIARAPADGYTLITVAGPTLYATPVPDIGKELAPIIRLALQPMVLAGTTKRDVKDFAALVAAMKAKPEDWSYATAGIASSHHLLGEEINELAGTKMLHVPYRGGGAAMNDALAGSVPLIIVGAGPVIQQVEAKTLRVYAISTKQRLPQLPDVPTFAELGFPQIDASQWFGIAIHADTPKEIAARLHKEIADIVRQPAFAKVLETFGAVAASGTAEEWGTFYASEYKNRKALAERLGIPVQ